MVTGTPELAPTPSESQFNVFLPPHVANLGESVSVGEETLTAIPFNSRTS